MSEETASALHLREALQGLDLDVIALLVRHRGWQIMLGWNGAERRWEAHGETERDYGGPTTAEGLGPTISVALDACADVLDRYCQEDAGDIDVGPLCLGCDSPAGEPCDPECEVNGAPGCLSDEVDIGVGDTARFREESPPEPSDPEPAALGFPRSGPQTLADLAEPDGMRARVWASVESALAASVDVPQDAEGRALEDAARERLFGRPTSEVARLDFSKPPPGYEVGNMEDDDGRLVEGPESHPQLFSLRRGEFTAWAWNDPSDPSPVDLSVGAEHDSCGGGWSKAEALAAAWAHYKERRDPPGMVVIGDDTHGWFCEVQDPPQGGSIGPGSKPEELRGPNTCRTEIDARAAAWAWYERRLKLARGGDANPSLVGDPVGEWPRCLTWPDEQVAAVERWLADATAELPEVLRG